MRWKIYYINTKKAGHYDRNKTLNVRETRSCSP